MRSGTRTRFPPTQTIGLFLWCRLPPMHRVVVVVVIQKASKHSIVESDPGPALIWNDEDNERPFCK
jgi:hypothetical protein